MSLIAFSFSSPGVLAPRVKIIQLARILSLTTTPSFPIFLVKHPHPPCTSKCDGGDMGSDMASGRLTERMRKSTRRIHGKTDRLASMNFALVLTDRYVFSSIPQFARMLTVCCILVVPQSPLREVAGQLLHGVQGAGGCHGSMQR